MTQVTVSSKYQVVIPRDVRRHLNLKAGKRLVVIVKEGVISMVPYQPVRRLRGFLKGMRLGEVREKKDRL